ncbi:MAG: efflux RND transporter periplasmic adaptor subunit [Burkholderiales bacterium]|nr:efflux RND transporter periplasmic adaptor subunit [Burkholderiales bacterium]
MKTVRLLALSLAALLAAGCSEPPPPKTEEIRLVRVLKLGPIERTRTVEYPGDVRARYETRLGFRVPGKILERLVEVGSKVRAGQPIARLDARDLALAAMSARAQVAQAEADKTLAAADLARFRELRAKNFISQAELERRQSLYDTAAARLDAARAQARQAGNQTGYALLAADTAGVITAIEAEAGQVVGAGQTVARLARPGDREIAIAVPESQRDLVVGASEFTITLNALGGRSWSGRLREVSPAADPATRTYGARISIAQAGDEVELGMSARVTARFAARDSRFELPVAALYSKGDTPKVWLVDSGGTVRLQPVKTGGLAGAHVLIDSGLKPGDTVVIAGAQMLHAGERVRLLGEK